MGAQLGRLESFGAAIAWAVLGLMVTSLAGLLADPGPVGAPGSGDRPSSDAREPALASTLGGTSSGEFALSISASALVGEAGTLTTFTASPVGGVPPFNITWSDSFAGTGQGDRWAVAPPSAGNLSVVAIALDGIGETAEAAYQLPVAGPLFIGLPSVPNATDFGQPVAVTLTLSGGMPPYALSYALPDQAPQIALPPRAGPFDILLTPSVGGPAYLSVNLSDSLGGEARAVGLIATVAGPLLIQWDDLPGVAETGVALSVRADVLGGTVPLTWSALIAGPIAPGSPSGGTIGSPGLVLWNGTFAAPGNATLVLTVTDARGWTTSIRGSIAVLPPVDIVPLRPVNGTLAGSSLAIDLSIRGGTPPYAIEATASDGESASALLGVGQNFTWTLTPLRSGNLSIVVQATDLAGGVVSESWGLVVVAPPVDSPAGTAQPSIDPGPLPAEVSAVVLAGFGAVALFLWSRYRRTPRSTPAHNPIDLTDVQRMLADGQGLERETLYLIGEEQGLARSTVAAQLEEGRRTGRISVERAVTGDDVFRWVADPTPPPSTEVRS